MQEFSKIGKKLPHKLEVGQLDFLVERCKAVTTQRQRSSLYWWIDGVVGWCQENIFRGQYALLLTSAVAMVIVVVGVYVLKSDSADGLPESFEALVESVDYDTLQHLADTNYDDIELNIY